MTSNRATAYIKAGVDISAGNKFVDRIRGHVAGTRTVGVISEIGGFGGLFRPDLNGINEPVLVSSTDGVGTKLKLAFAFNKHDSVGIDLVAMSVNDILVQGAHPLFFLDYFATGRLDIEIAQTVISGIAQGCRLADCALLGGETAEMPDMYAPGEYDLAGFCVGIVDKAKLIDGSGIQIGDKIIGLPSSGLHSNGFSLVRKIFIESGLSAEDFLLGSNLPMKDALLTPTTIYVNPIRSLLRDVRVKGMVHITGGGFYDNIPRILSPQVEAHITFGSWSMPPVFTWIKEAGRLSWPEMLQIFNCGIGYILIISPEQADAVISKMQAFHLNASIIGKVSERSLAGEQVVINF